MKVFEHGLCLSICLELLDCVQMALARGRPTDHPKRQAHAIQFSGLDDFDSDLPTSMSELMQRLRSLKNRLAMWTNNINDPRPRLLPLKVFTLHLIEQIKAQVPCFENTRFNVFIDEYENMLQYQRQFINTLLKHSEEPLIFNIAIKRNALEERSTVGEESLQEVNDLRSIDLEERFGDCFDVFCAEIFLFRLLKELPVSPVDPDVLRNPDIRGISGTWIIRK